MCGLCGFTGHVEGYKHVLANMMDRIIHRGPDSAGYYIDNKVNLGFRRLSIIDLKGGDQPIYNEDGSVVIVFNGEIYNYKTLREELVSKGHIFKTSTDTEVIVHGYEEYGSKILEKLRGMFAFVVWDSKNEILFCARDFFGIKPFYYGLIENNLVFGSEIKSILEYPGYVRELNEEALEQYLSFQYSVLPETFFKGIFKLPPGHYLIFSDGKISIERYWTPTFEKEDITLSQTVTAIDEILQDSVAAHMVSDVEVGSFLSGGVDSSYVASLFNGDKTFSVSFEYEDYNETKSAEELSRYIGISHYSKVITPQEYWVAIPKVIYHLDEPLSDPSCISLFFLCNYASRFVKVVLSGEGADELFGGYNIYHEPIDLNGYQRLPLVIRKSLARIAAKIPFTFKGKNYLIRGAKTVEERFIGNANIFSFEERRKILKKPFATKSPQELTGPYYDIVKDKDDITKMQYIDINFWLTGDILLKSDKMSMANSLEIRVPFLDREVMKTASCLPPSHRINDRNTKYAMRLAAGKHIPECTADRKKLGFPTPIRIWLREDEYYNIVKKSFAGSIARRYFNTEVLIKLLDEHKKGKKDNSRKIWTIYIFLVWYNEFMTQKY